MDAQEICKGRFAPSPTGRMHVGNLFTALISWLSVRHAGGQWILRIEDLDPQRSKEQYARQIEDDLNWLGLDWDEGGLDNRGANGPYSQSCRGEIYSRFLDLLKATGFTYPCTCTRADILATQAPHQSDGRVIYSGKCRPAQIPSLCQNDAVNVKAATRLYVPDQEIVFDDIIAGIHRVNLSHECGDFVLRRADGAWAYQLAVVVDDALMGVTEVIRGNDLLLSAAQQIYLYRLLRLPVPEFGHLPLICNSEGRRLSKRDASLSSQQLRARYTPEQVIGRLACLAGLQPTPDPISAAKLAKTFDWRSISRQPTIPSAEKLFD